MNFFNIMAFIVLIVAIIAWICKLDIGQSYLLPIWIAISMMVNNEK